MLGEVLCSVEGSPDMTIKDLKAEIAEKSGVAAMEQKIFSRSSWEPIILNNAKTLKEAGLETGAEVVLVRQQPFNGTYRTEVTWNGKPQLQILGNHAKWTWGDETGWESEITWEGSPPDCQATFKGRRNVTTSWATRSTRGSHTAEDGVEETLCICFKGETGAEGFKGRFQRQFEGPLDAYGTFLGDEVDD
mmetsp:Transcript_44854/g.83832  ORF Transcript_44854/g.83832 Transcript_44854/m.83832 type:complete len:191 (+) Transcript_44854:3-575(+)